MSDPSGNSEALNVAHIPLSAVLQRRTGFGGVRPIHSDWWWVRPTACVFISQRIPVLVRSYLSTTYQPTALPIVNYCLWYHPFVLVLVERRTGTGTESSSRSAS